MERASIFGEMGGFDRFKEGGEEGFGRAVVKVPIVVIVLISLRSIGL
jgi:hypothetical protein